MKLSKKLVLVVLLLAAPVLVFAKSENANSAAGESIEETINESVPKYTPKSENGLLHSSLVSKAVQQLVRATDRFENPGIGEEVREIARAHGQDEDKANQSMDESRSKPKILKFFFGADYKQLKEVKKVMTQNTNRIRKLEKLMDRVQNETESQALQEQLTTLQVQNLELENQYKEELSGFSLFGWLAKLFS